MNQKMFRSEKLGGDVAEMQQQSGWFAMTLGNVSCCRPVTVVWPREERFAGVVAFGNPAAHATGRRYPGLSAVMKKTASQLTRRAVKPIPAFPAVSEMRECFLPDRWAKVFQKTAMNS
jgi:hypothetical protein